MPAGRLSGGFGRTLAYGTLFSVWNAAGAGNTEMDAETVAAWAFGIAVLAFLWNLHRDMRLLSKDISDLRDRVSRIEGMLAGAGLKISSGPES